MDDPLSGLMVPGREKSVSLQLQGASIEDAQVGFFNATGYILVVPAGTQGAVTVSVDKVPITEALDAVAKSLNSKWHEFYLIAKMRPLTQEEIAARADQQTANTMNALWAMSDADRAKAIQDRINALDRVQQRMKDAPPDVQARMQQRMTRRIGRMAKYMAGLGADQRAQLRPLLSKMGQIAGGQ
jgi:hypothetical protein